MFNLIGISSNNWIKKISNELYFKNKGAKERKKALKELAKLAPPVYNPPAILNK